MPHKDGKIYTETRNGVKYGVSCHDVAATIGAASLDVGTLCTHPNITVGAMYKPFICDTPAPPTMAQRRGAQYGIYIPTAAIRSTSLADDKGNTPPRWRHIPPSGNEWKRLDDFEGYSHNAPIPVEATVKTAGGSVHVDFKFNGATENGGIAPSVLDVINVGTMSDLYPGFALYAPDGKNHTFKYVATSPVKIGSQKSLSMDFPVSSLGNGFFEVFPILSPKPYSFTHSPAAGDNHLVVFADGVMTTFDFYDMVTGTPLLTRRYIGTEYYTRIGAAIIDRAADGAALPDYRVQFLTNNYLQLTPTPAFRTLAAKDNRIMVNMEFVYSNTGYSGLKDWIPIKGGITSLENFNAIRGTTYAYALCRWSSAASEDIMLVLKYELDSNVPASWNSTGWQIGFRRSLAIVDEGREIWTGVYGNSITVKGTSAGVNSVTETSLERIRFGNTVSGNSATENTATGLYLQANDLSATISNGNLAIKSESNIYGELFFNSVNIEGGNVTNNTGTNRIYQVTRMPVATEVYLDISVDSAETQDESLNWLNA